MLIAIIGSRTFTNYELLKDTLKTFNPEGIVSGGAQGADTLAERYAKENNIPIKVFLPDWQKHGKYAGVLRNNLIVREADTVIAFWDGESKGTLSSINIAKKLNKKLFIIKF